MTAFLRWTAAQQGYVTMAYCSPLWHAQQLYAYADNPDVIDLATAYTVGILRNHPFFDGNKRTGFVVGILFLELNGYNFIATEEATTQAVIELAAGTLNEAGYRAFLRANSEAK